MIEVVSVGRGPLSTLLEQWWVTVEVTEEGRGATRARIAVEWSPWTRRFTVGSDGVGIVARGEEGRRASAEEPSVEEIVSEFVGSAAEREAISAIQRIARRYRRELRERVQSISTSH